MSTGAIISTIIGSVIALILGSNGLFVWIVKRGWKKQEDKKAELERLKAKEEDEKRKVEIKEITTEVVNEGIKPVNESINILTKEVTLIKKDVSLNKEADLASLRDSILSNYRSCEHKGYKDKDDAMNFRDMCQCYQKLGGNSFIDEDIIPAFNKLPLKSEFVSKTRRSRKSKQPLLEGSKGE